MENTPAPEGGTRAVEKGPEPLSQDRGREAPFRPSYPESGNLGEELATKFPKPPSPAKEEAETAGAAAARQIPSASVPQTETPRSQTNLPAAPTTRRMDKVTRAGLAYVAARAAQRGPEQKQVA